MERSDLLEANGGIFKPQGEAINAGAADDVRVLVVGNPANTNALIAQSNAPDVPRERFTAMMRLDHNRAVAQLANKLGGRLRRHQHDRLGQPLADPVPRPRQRQGRGRDAWDAVDDEAWIADEFIPRVAQARRRGDRGARRLERRLGRQRRDRPRPRLGPGHARATTGSRWRVPSDGSYGIEEGLICGFPCKCRGGEYSIVEGLEIDDFSRSASTQASPSCATSATRSAASGWSRAALRAAQPVG